MRDKLRQALAELVRRCDLEAGVKGWGEWGELTAARAALAEPAPCIGADPLCPCQDGLACHYKDAADGTKGWPVPAAPTLTDEQILTPIRDDMNHDDLAYGAPEPLSTEEAAEIANVLPPTIEEAYAEGRKDEREHCIKACTEIMNAYGGDPAGRLLSSERMRMQHQLQASGAAQCIDRIKTAL